VSEEHNSDNARDTNTEVDFEVIGAGFHLVRGSQQPAAGDSVRAVVVAAGLVVTRRLGGASTNDLKSTSVLVSRALSLLCSSDTQTLTHLSSVPEPPISSRCVQVDHGEC